MLSALRLLARHGRFVLVAGLVAGLALPDVALVLRPWLSELVLLLLFLTAFRIGPQSALQGLSVGRRSIGVVLGYQLALPLLCIAVFALFGIADSPAAIALTLMFAAPSVTGSPNMSIMLGHAPEPAFRVLILGTLILPITIIPIFWLSPALGDLSYAMTAALRLGVSICVTVALAFALRALLRPRMPVSELQVLDGITSLALAVVVVGLMSAVAPALSSAPLGLAGWMLLVIAANLGMQVVAFFLLRRFGFGDNAAPCALIAGNRNVALFLVASSATESEAFLIFLGCYQIPMYLTPIVMRPILGRRTTAA